MSKNYNVKYVFLSSSIKTITPLHWEKHEKSECVFSSCACLWCHGFRDDNSYAYNYSVVLLAVREGEESCQGHGSETEPNCVLWQILPIDVYTIGTLHFEIKMRCAVFV